MSFWDQATEEGGGGIETFAGTITNAYFQPGDYGTSLVLIALFDEPELYPQKEDGTYTMFFPCGKGWTTSDGGDTVTHDSGDTNKAYRKDSDAGRLFDQLKTVPGLRDAAPDFNPYVAKSYTGLGFEFGRVPFEKRVPKRDDDGQTVNGPDGRPVFVDKAVNIMMPVALKGGTAEVAPVDIGDLDLSNSQIAALGAAKTDTDFMKVLMEEGLTGNPKVMGLVSSNLPGFKAALPF